MARGLLAYSPVRRLSKGLAGLARRGLSTTSTFSVPRGRQAALYRNLAPLRRGFFMRVLRAARNQLLGSVSSRRARPLLSTLVGKPDCASRSTEDRAPLPDWRGFFCGGLFMSVPLGDGWSAPRSGTPGRQAHPLKRLDDVEIDALLVAVTTEAERRHTPIQCARGTPWTLWGWGRKPPLPGKKKAPPGETGLGRLEVLTTNHSAASIYPG